MHSKAYTPGNYVEDELPLPRTEEGRKAMLKVWEDLTPKYDGERFGDLYITGTADAK